jgi:predicted O-methyltransferase YrrM
MGVPDDIEAFAAAIGPEPDAVLEAMDRRAEATDFPTVGPAVGGWLRALADLVDAERVFEFGSGFGYSAYWFLGGMAEDGEIVLTEIDAEELDAAREYLGRGGYADRARFEVGDAVEIVEGYEGPFDIALLDNEKARYVEAFEAIRAEIPVGGLVVADNAVEGPHEFGTLRRLIAGDGGGDEDGDGPDDPTDAARGIAAYLEHVRSAEGFETTLLPVGEGLAVTRRTE